MFPSHIESQRTYKHKSMNSISKCRRARCTGDCTSIFSVALACMKGISLDPLHSLSKGNAVAKVHHTQILYFGAVLWFALHTKKVL